MGIDSSSVNNSFLLEDDNFYHFIMDLNQINNWMNQSKKKK